MSPPPSTLSATTIPNSARRVGVHDPGNIKFNHAIHLKNDLRGSSRESSRSLVPIATAPDNTEPWPYGKADETAARLHGGRKYMEPVNYYEHCSTCHPLTFDRRFTEPAPHKDPDIVHDFSGAEIHGLDRGPSGGTSRTQRDADIRIPGTQRARRATQPPGSQPALRMPKNFCA